MHSLMIEKSEPYFLLVKMDAVSCIGMDFLRQRIWPSVFSDCGRNNELHKYRMENKW